MVTIPSTPNGVTITHQLAHALAGGPADMGFDFKNLRSNDTEHAQWCNDDTPARARIVSGDSPPLAKDAQQEACWCSLPAALWLKSA